MTHSMRLLWIGGTAHCLCKSVDHAMEFDGRRWRHRDPLDNMDEGHCRWWRAITNLFRRCSGYSQRDADVGPVEHETNNLVRIGFRDSIVVSDAHVGLLVAHPHNPLFVTSDGIVRPLATGVQP